MWTLAAFARRDRTPSSSRPRPGSRFTKTTPPDTPEPLPRPGSPRTTAAADPGPSERAGTCGTEEPVRARQRLVRGDGDRARRHERPGRDRFAGGLEQAREVEAVQPARLHEEIRAADEVAHALQAEGRD